jgi:hypothetical protein
VGSWAISCDSCDLRWMRPGVVSDYERQAIESRPCPCCGAYTLTCPTPKLVPGPRRERPSHVDHGNPQRAAA